MAKQLYDYWFVQFDFPNEEGKPYKSSGGEMVWNEKLKRKIPNEWDNCKLKDFINLFDSKRIPLSSKDREERKGNYPYYGATGIMDYVNEYIFDGDYILLAEDGSTSDSKGFPIVQYIWGKNWVNNHAHVLKFKTYTERRYVEYYLNSIDLTPYISGAAQPKLNKKSLESISIPAPSLEDQARIVAILDKFDALTHSISEGLPREIELRQKQYAYYRDMLFNFPKSKKAAG